MAGRDSYGSNATAPGLYRYIWAHSASEHKIVPLLFFSIGGYLAIKGHLSLGALVAVLAAYADMTSPWRELLDYYQQKEDMTIRFQQVVREFFIESSARQ